LYTQYETISVELLDHVAILWLNRPQVHNAFNDAMLSELGDFFEKIDRSNEVRVVIVSGKGKSFSAGADLNWMKEMINYSYQENLKDSEMISKVFYSIYNSKKPVIAAINGAAIGGGMGFVGAADIVIASTNAKFSLSEVKIGVVPACISPYLINKAPQGALKELFITGMRFAPEKALNIHLINYIVEPDQLIEFAMQIAGKLLNCGPQAIAICKKLFSDIPEMSIQEAYHYTAEIIAKLRISDEAQEGMKAFLEKRSPSWQVNPNAKQGG